MNRLSRLSGYAGAGSFSRVSRYTARFHLPAATCEGLVAGVFTLNDIVLRKSLGAGTVLVTLLVMAAPVSQLLSIVWGNLMEGRDKRPFILGLGGVGRTLLLFVAFATSPLAFAVPVIVSIGLSTATIPALNALYQTNYTSLERGRIFGWVMSATALATIGASLAAGAWMDADPRAYRFLYPAAGILGIVSAYLYYRIRARRAAGIERGARAGRESRAEIGDWLGDVERALRHPLRGIARTFREDPGFRRFEVAYMVYGLAFMMLQPVLPIFLVDEIHVQYHEVGMARGLIFWGVISLASPFFGRLLDRTNAVRVSLVSFSLLLFFPLLLAASRSIGLVYVAFGLYGLAMAGVNLAWTMGPILFAGSRDAARYMGVHVAMVGIRGLVGNPLGLFLLETVGSRGAFLASSGCFALATWLTWRLDRDAGRWGEGRVSPRS